MGRHRASNLRCSPTRLRQQKPALRRSDAFFSPRFPSRIPSAASRSPSTSVPSLALLRWSGLAAQQVGGEAFAVRFAAPPFAVFTGTWPPPSLPRSLASAPLKSLREWERGGKVWRVAARQPAGDRRRGQVGRGACPGKNGEARRRGEGGGDGRRASARTRPRGGIGGCGCRDDRVNAAPSSAAGRLRGRRRRRRRGCGSGRVGTAALRPLRGS